MIGHFEYESSNFKDTYSKFWVGDEFWNLLYVRLRVFDFRARVVDFRGHLVDFDYAYSRPRYDPIGLPYMQAQRIPLSVETRNVVFIKRYPVLTKRAGKECWNRPLFT